jgi:hypothetical protein
MVALLLKRNGRWDMKDGSGQLPIDVALDKSAYASDGDMDSEWVNIVTLLRLTALESETRDDVAVWSEKDLGIEEALGDLKGRGDGRRRSVERVGVEMDGFEREEEEGDGVELHVPQGFFGKRETGFANVSDPWAQSRWEKEDEEVDTGKRVSMEDLNLEEGGF